MKSTATLIKGKICWVLGLALLTHGLAQERTNRIVILRTREDPQPVVAVYLPEQLTTYSQKYQSGELRRHQVEAMVKKTLLDANCKLVEIESAPDKMEIPRREALEKARAKGATHLIWGLATATQLTHQEGALMHKNRASTEITVTVYDLAKDQILAVEEAGSTGSADALKSAAQGALREASRKIARKLSTALRPH